MVSRLSRCVVLCCVNNQDCNTVDLQLSAGRKVRKRRQLTRCASNAFGLGRCDVLIIGRALAMAVNVWNPPFAMRVFVCQLTLAVGETKIINFARCAQNEVKGNKSQK